MGIVEGNSPAKDNDWEAVTNGGSAAIKKWIAGQMDGRTCAVVLVGAATAGRKWIDHEIIEAWNKGLGVVGVRIHKLTNLDGEQAERGANPFAHIAFGDERLSSVVKLYDPSGSTSKEVYADISANLSELIEEAIQVRSTY